MEPKLEIEKIEEKYLIPKDCVILDRHNYDMLMNKFYDNRLYVSDYENRIEKALEYIDDNIIKIEFFKRQIEQKGGRLDHITIETTATEMLELIKIIKGEE